LYARNPDRADSLPRLSLDGLLVSMAEAFWAFAGGPLRVDRGPYLIEANEDCGFSCEISSDGGGGGNNRRMAVAIALALAT
jgi:hypothetical protein